MIRSSLDVIVKKEDDKKAYSKPRIIYETELETQAGSPLSGGPRLPGEIVP